MTHLGDITQIDDGKIEPVDVITAGSPCQDLSVAGKRGGMKHGALGDDETTRSGLFMEFVRIVKEMRGATNGKYPAFVVWENVPGAFSSNKGEDFRCVLEELCKIIDPGTAIPRPAKGKWRNAGAIMGDGWSLAWRVVDAQYWGVPQRRRRISLVMDLRGESAPKIQFKPEGMPGYPAPGRKAGQGIAAAAEDGVAGAIAVRMREGCAGGGKGPLIQIEKSGTLATGNDRAIFCLQGNMVDRDVQQNGSGVNEDVAFTLNSTDRHAVAFLAGQGAKAGGIGYAVEAAPTLKAAGSGTNQTPTVCVPELARTLTARHDGSYNPATESGQNIIAVAEPQITGTLTAQCRNTSPMSEQMANIVAILPFDTTQVTSPGNYSNPKYGDPCHPLCAAAEPPSIVCMAHGQANAEILDDLCPTLNCSGVFAQKTGGTGSTTGRPAGTHEQPIVNYRYIVRRLTPMECERLQYFPDNFTLIPDYTDSKGKKKKASDSARYKALGNSIARVAWILLLQRISDALGRPGKLGSLFDGIGGFPLIWEEINGPGAAVWASEIDEFPMAVTKYRLPDKTQTKAE